MGKISLLFQILQLDEYAESSSPTSSLEDFKHFFHLCKPEGAVFSHHLD